MDGGELVKLIIEFIRKRWHRNSTLLILVLFVLGALLVFFSAVNLQEIESVEIWVGSIVLLAVVVVWFYSTRIPKASKEKIGFAVGIKTDDPEQQLKIKRDFVEALRELLYKSKYKYNFEFVEIPDHILEKIDSPDVAQKMLYELRCKFMVYGKARTVILKGGKQHALNLEGVVAHRPIANQISKSFSKEFAELFPRQVLISSEGDLFKFEFTANWIDVVSRYIIGIAALLSGDFEYAQELFESLQEKIQDKDVKLDAAIKIRDRLPNRLKDVYLVRIQLCYEDWKRTKDVNDIEKMKPLLEKMDIVSPGNHDARVFHSLWHFIVKRDVTKAKDECVKGKDKRNIAWRYNYAFLFAYEGNLERAQKEYKHAFKGYYQEPSFIFNIVDFILWVLDVEPDRIQLYYCLGLIYFHVINDFSLSLQGFEKFLELTNMNQYMEQREEAEKMISEIQKSLQTSDL